MNKVIHYHWSLISANKKKSTAHLQLLAGECQIDRGMCARKRRNTNRQVVQENNQAIPS